MLAMFATMFEMFKRNSEGAAAGHLRLLQKFYICHRSKRLKCPAAVVPELRVLEHLKHGVEHGHHDHLALHQLASVQGRSLRISDYLSCRAF